MQKIIFIDAVKKGLFINRNLIRDIKEACVNNYYYLVGS